MKKLKSCPFCGREPRIVNEKHILANGKVWSEVWSVFCSRCNIKVGLSHDGEIAAVKRWNKRAEVEE